MKLDGDKLLQMLEIQRQRFFNKMNQRSCCHIEYSYASQPKIEISQNGPKSSIITFSYSLAKQRWGFCILIGWFIKFSVQSNVSTTNCNLQEGNSCIIIGDVYQFISHCLIPVDPWAQSLVNL